MTIPVSILDVPRQNDNFNCGVYAIAYAADILAGKPATSVYDVTKMRIHLVECLRGGKLRPFPVVNTTKSLRKLLGSIDVVHVSTF